MSLEDKSLSVILSVMNNKNPEGIEKLIESLDIDVIRSLHNALDKHGRKWTFYVLQIIDYMSWRKFDETIVYADSVSEAMEKLAYIWNNGGNPEDSEGECEDDYFLSDIIDVLDENDDIVRITPEELQKIIFVTGKGEIEPYFTGRTDSTAAEDHTKIEMDIPHKFHVELRSLYNVN